MTQFIPVRDQKNLTRTQRRRVAKNNSRMWASGLLNRKFHYQSAPSVRAVMGARARLFASIRTRG